MPQGNSVPYYFPVSISILALIASGISLILNLKKYKIDKSILRAEIKRIRATTLTAMYPSMENDNSTYSLGMQITNSGYREELITKIVFTYQKSYSEIEYEEKVSEKSQRLCEFEFKRFEIMQLRKITIIPAEDQSVSIKKREIAKWQREILRHIQELKSEWQDGKRIEQ
ncbi:MAG: hypothetical protein L6406_18265 [Desulfobacterales bacterium]|nr:hypothetical protein [Desulfobacterales bacterium]